MILRRGSTGRWVERVQVALSIPVDGVYGPLTEAAVRRFQRDHGLRPDGLVGANTLTALGIPVLAAPPITRAEILARAASAVGRGIRYGLGLGGTNPEAKHPGAWAIRKLRPAWWCDCSGYVAWCLGISRDPARRRDGWPWWLSTDSVWNDARGAQVLFVRVLPGQEQPGDIGVYPDYRVGTKKYEGHIAVVKDPRLHLVYDCGSTSGGITERRLSIMWNRPDAIFVRYKGAA